MAALNMWAVMATSDRGTETGGFQILAGVSVGFCGAFVLWATAGGCGGSGDESKDAASPSAGESILVAVQFPPTGVQDRIDAHA